MDYLDRNPFTIQLKDEEGLDRVGIKIARCPEKGACGDHPYIEALQAGEDPASAPVLPFVTVTACLAYAVRCGTGMALSGEDSMELAGWALIEYAVRYRLEMTATVHRSTLN
jgi:hypothetical protein